MKPIIGIVALYDEKRHSYWMLPEYTEAINKSGGIPIILPYNVDIEAIMPSGYQSPSLWRRFVREVWSLS